MDYSLEDLVSDQEKLDGYRAVRKARIERVLIRVFCPIIATSPLSGGLIFSVLNDLGMNAIGGFAASLGGLWFIAFFLFGIAAEDFRKWIYRWSAKSDEETMLKRTEKRRLNDIAFLRRMEADPEFRKIYIEQLRGVR